MDTTKDKLYVFYSLICEPKYNRFTVNDLSLRSIFWNCFFDLRRSSTNTVVSTI